MSQAQTLSIDVPEVMRLRAATTALAAAQADLERASLDTPGRVFIALSNAAEAEVEAASARVAAWFAGGELAFELAGEVAR